MRWVVAVAAAAGAAWIAFRAEPWELLPFRDERVLAPLGSAVGSGFGDFYRVLLPLDPAGTPEMHGLVLARDLRLRARDVAARRGGAAGRGGGRRRRGRGLAGDARGRQAVALGALALAAALSIPLLLRVRSGASLLAGASAAAAVVVGSCVGLLRDDVAREAVLDWESWDLHGVAPARRASASRGTRTTRASSFPPTKTVVLTVEGPERARVLARLDARRVRRTTTGSRTSSGRAASRRDSGPMPPDAFTPRGRAARENWLEQQVEVKALVDDQLAAAGTPIVIDSRRLGIVFRLSGGVLRVFDPLGRGQRYRVWSYAPDPAPAMLGGLEARATRPRADAYLDAREPGVPALSAHPGARRRVRALLEDPVVRLFWPYSALYAAARRVVGGARTPYESVLALESWFRHRGGFRYDESPPQVSGPPLVGFVTRTKAGYCQHYAGAMTLMLRMLGIPARVAVGFTSGTLEDGKWVVTDHDAHAWVEVWFAGTAGCRSTRPRARRPSAATTPSRRTRRRPSPRSTAAS